MKKSRRIENLVEELAGEIPAGYDPRYAGYFVCFNRRQYYEAHDVLEDLWLSDRSANAPYYKGLIQIAGALVHLKKQYLRPFHHKDGARLRPAVRLFRLGLSNVGTFQSPHLGLDLCQLEQRCLEMIEAIEGSSFRRNPWRPEAAFELRLAGSFSGRVADPAASV